jgi:excisionase family DNA binding protein
VSAPLLTARQLAAELQVHEDTIYRWCRRPPADGGVPCLRAGAIVRFDRDEVIQWMAEGAGRVVPATRGGDR